ncbi:hypothetical protein NPS53_08825 [Pseudomonas putida]|uniref:hypothetical protein n=1 Tax=Pseudomonas putida TaxID=303 RepID=UPI002363795C|nr:hypothetical protein [Pseudomonas putida]MDD2139677.1 hypothetical protein [Pseudomonas putida]HDS1721601.1 hypothetical protein [Pseudomonas putida]
MRTPHVAPSAAYEADERFPASHTILINDERDECGSATTWTFPMGLPQSMGLAVVSLVDSAPGELEAVPAVEVHACHREAIKAYLASGKLVIDTKGVPLKLNEQTGLYELDL